MSVESLQGSREYTEAPSREVRWAVADLALYKASPPVGFSKHAPAKDRGGSRIASRPRQVIFAAALVDVSREVDEKLLHRARSARKEARREGESSDVSGMPNPNLV